MAGPIDLDAWEDEFDPEDDRLPRGRRVSQAARDRIEAIEDTARVVSTHRGEVEVVRDDGVIVPATYGGSMRGERVVVGDEVRVQYGSETEPGRMLARLPRRTWLARSEDDGGEPRLVVANVDRVFVVVAADTLKAGLRLLDRVLVAASLGGLGAGVIVTKVDLDASAHVDAGLAAHASLVDLVVMTSAVDGTGVDEARRVLSSGWSVLVGHSGVGKSRLFNALLPDVEQRVGAVGRRGGRHTTVRALAHPLGDGWLVDTPGIRSFGISGVSPADLAAHWPGLAGVACEADGCTHTGEAGCRAADAIGEARLARYRQVHAGLASQADS